MTTVFMDMDCEDPRYRHHRGQPYICDWLRAHRIDPDLCYRFEILADGDGTVRAHMHNSQGPDYPGTVWIAALSAPIPVQLFKDWGPE